MTSIVLDCSMTMAWCFTEEADDRSWAVLEATRNHGAWVPALWALEVANVLVAAERRHTLDARRSAHFIDMLRQLPIQIDESTPDYAFGSTLALARAQDLTLYDASYLELAQRRGLPLATRDKALLRAAERCNVPQPKLT